jgi:CubicO group peptidase (beta-lactamase class C family)
MLQKSKLKPETVRLMSTNYLPTDIHTYAYINPGEYIPFGGFGLGFAVKLPNSNISGSMGTFGWSGAAHTSFFIDPKEKLIGIFLTQMFPPGYKLEMIQEFGTTVYDSIK